MNYLCVSRDIYHENSMTDRQSCLVTQHEKKYSLLSVASKGKNLLASSSSKTRFEDYLINEGNAKKNNIGKRELSPESLVWDSDYGDDIVRFRDNVVYITVEGDVVIGCDWSYASMRNLSIGNVLNESLFDILMRAAKKE